MNDKEKIHYLTEELIPFIDDVEKETKQIMLEHMKVCESCQQLYEETVEFDQSIPMREIEQPWEIKPLKKLVQFNTGLKAMLIIVRLLMLIFIGFISFADINNLHYHQTLLYFFYAPASLFLLVFTYTFFQRKWLWISIAFDVFIIFILIKVIGIFI